MKRLILSLLLVQGCASWKHKDFEKEIEKSNEQEAKVEVTEELREKFQVQQLPVEEVKADPAPLVPKAKRPAASAKKVIQKVLEKKVSVTPQVPPKALVPALPADYPADLVALNEKAKKVWDTYVPNHQVDEKVYLDIHYLGMTVGKIMFTNKGKRMINNQEVWHFHARFKSAPFYSNIYELDDTVDTYVATDKFLSVRFSLVQRESKQDVDDLQLQDRDKLKTFSFYKQKKSDGTIRDKQKEGYIPYFCTDPFSVLFFYQGLPLKNGDVFEIPMVNKGKVLILKSTVEGREVVETGKGSKRAIRVHATTQYSGDHLKSGDMYFWFSDDEKRTFLKARAKIKIGSVTADIVEG